MFNIQHDDDHGLIYTDGAGRQWRVDEDGDVPEIIMAAAAAQAVSRGIDRASVSNDAWRPDEGGIEPPDYRQAKKKQYWRSVNVTRYNP